MARQIKTIADSETQWRETNRAGVATASLHNARVMIHRLGYVCQYDSFHEKIRIGPRNGVAVQVAQPLIGEMSNSTLVQLRQIMSITFEVDPTEKFVWDAVQTLAYDNCYDPVLDFLEEAQGAWDGTARLGSWVVDYLGCDDTELNRAIGRKVLVAAVRRVRQPGCKFDNITVLESPEGRHKSKAIMILAGKENFSDQSILGARDREVQEILQGIWMHENADLAGMRKAEVEHVKSVLSREVDRARPAYGKVREDRRRRSIEWGTTNNREYLQSQTGNRRFWPLETGTIKIEELERDRAQLFGEAGVVETAGESLLLDAAMWDAVGEAQEYRRVKDAWEDLLVNVPQTMDGVRSANGHALDSGEGFGVRIIYEDEVPSQAEANQLHKEGISAVEFKIQKVRSRDLLTHVLGVPTGQQNSGHGMRLAAAMKKLGWRRHQNNQVNISGLGSERGYWRQVPNCRQPSNEDFEE